MECCCGGVSCNTIPLSLCSDGYLTWDGCGYAEFTCEESGTLGTEGYQPKVETSCPPKFYRTRTVVITEASSGYYQLYMDGDPFERATWSSTLSAEITYRYVECSPTLVAATGTSTSSSKYENPPPAVETDDFCESNLSLVDGLAVWNGTVTHNGFYPIHDPTPWSEPAGYCSWDYSPYYNGVGGAVSGPNVTVTKSKTSMQLVINSPYSSTPVNGNGWLGESSSLITVTETLSDEITLHDSLLSVLCPAVPCDPNTESGCIACCDDDSSFIKYSGSGCVAPGSSPLAWDASSCSANTRSGQSSRLSLWFSGLTVGQCYQVTLTFGRCEFAKDGEGHYLVPTCESGVPCTDAPNETFTQTLPIFQAEAWGEMLTDNCGRCDIAAILCWLNANKPEGATVACTIGAIDVPAIQNHYTWFSSCSIVSVECPTPP